eukprot:6131411-Prymnesium_polylepis.1
MYKWYKGEPSCNLLSYSMDPAARKAVARNCTRGMLSLLPVKMYTRRQTVVDDAHARKKFAKEIYIARRASKKSKYSACERHDGWG